MPLSRCAPLVTGEALLAKSDDFGQTDISLAQSIADLSRTAAIGA